MVDLGTIEQVDLREVWPHEAQDFTPWLAENLDKLGEALGLDLELLGSVDILNFVRLSGESWNPKAVRRVISRPQLQIAALDSRESGNDG